MKILSIKPEPLRIPFKQRFSHHSCSRVTGESVLVTVTTTCGVKAQGEGCPRTYVTGETVDSALAFIRSIQEEIVKIQSLRDLKHWVETHETLINAHPAAWCAVELAIIQCLARVNQINVEQLLEVPTNRSEFEYTGVIGAETLPTSCRVIEQYIKLGMRQYKLKVSGYVELDQAKIRSLNSLLGIQNYTLRIDANNAWGEPEEASEYLSKLNAPNLCGLEEPLKPRDYDGLVTVAQQTKVPIILDESLVYADDVQALRKHPTLWIGNLRVSKLGGLIRSLAMLKQLEAIGVPVMIGAQVGETSLLTRAGIVLSRACRNSPLWMEGAFGEYLLSEDIVPQVLQFGPGGLLRLSE